MIRFAIVMLCGTVYGACVLAIGYYGMKAGIEWVIEPSQVKAAVRGPGGAGGTATRIAVPAHVGDDSGHTATYAVVSIHVPGVSAGAVEFIAKPTVWKWPAHADTVTVTLMNRGHFSAVTIYREAPPAPITFRFDDGAISFATANASAYLNADGTGGSSSSGQLPQGSEGGAGGVSTGQGVARVRTAHRRGLYEPVENLGGIGKPEI
jgi:hypothetical protein